MHDTYSFDERLDLTVESRQPDRHPQADNSRKDEGEDREGDNDGLGASDRADDRLVFHRARRRERFRPADDSADRRRSCSSVCSGRDRVRLRAPRAACGPRYKRVTSARLTRAHSRLLFRQRRPALMQAASPGAWLGGAGRQNDCRGFRCRDCGFLPGSWSRTVLVRCSAAQSARPSAGSGRCRRFGNRPRKQSRSHRCRG